MPTLDWLTRDADLGASARVPVRLLREETELSAGDGENGLLVQGDNLEALRALLPFYAGQVKCIYIDPPYNTRSAFEHYDDNLEHSKWLGMIVPRLMLLREFLSEDGSIWVSIDDNEGHYLKVVMDEVFGRRNFVMDVTWQKRDGPPNDRKIGAVHEHLLIWSAQSELGSKQTRAERAFNLMPRTDKANAQYSVFKEPNGPDPRGPFRKIDTTANGKGGRFVQSLYYEVTNPFTGEKVVPRPGTCWRHSKEEMNRLQSESRLYWGVSGTARTPMRKLYLDEAKQGMSTPSVWAGLALNQHGSSELEKLFGEKATFETPKPERLIQRILHIATNPGDLVLDSFLGSGTTAAVAHKMGRRWIGIEMGDHARTHCAVRLRKVIDGEQGGISPDVGWQGGGGFRFATLGPAVYDADGVIAPDVRFADLARHVWFAETRRPLDGTPTSPVLGVIHPAPPPPDPEPAAGPDPEAPAPHSAPAAALAPDRAVALLFNGILRDRSPQGGNVLTRGTLALIRADLPEGFAGELVVYATACRLAPATLKAEQITFRQTPYDLNAGGR